ncbi:MAG: PKD domain-containing protein [Opitutales bacterium]|nr:PKD domain-containing protein [Opitutales bacterium]
MKSPVPRSLLLCLGFSIAAATAFGRPPLFLVDEDRLDEIRTLVTVPGTTHYEMFGAMKARVEANHIPGTSSYQRGYMAREATLMYLITGNTDYLDTAYTRLQEVYTVSLPDDQATPSSGSGLGRAQTLASFAMAYNWGYDGFTQEQRDWIRARVNEGFDTYGTALGHPNIEYQQQNSNWNGVVAGAHVMSLIAMDQHMDERRRDFQRSRDIVRVHPDSFGNRGWTQEGNFYFGLSMEYVFPAMAALLQIGDPYATTTFATRRPHHIILYASMFNAAQNSLTWGVGGDTIPNAGITSALFALVAPGELPAYTWFYDRARGILNPAAPASKYDYHAGGTVYGLIFYPENVTAADPTPSYPTVMNDNRGGYIFRSGWEDADTTIVGLWADTTNYGRSWSQADAGQISLMSYGTKWTAGPGPATSGLDNAFSQILVDGTARESTGTGALLGHKVSPTGGYARVSGGSKFASLGVSNAHRHVLTDFSPADFDIISTFDEMAAEDPRAFAWNAFVPGKSFTTGSESGAAYALLTEGDAYLKIWFVTPGAGFANGDNHVTYEYAPATALDIWTVMATGRGTPPVADISGSGNGAAVTLGDSVLTYNASTGSIESSTLTDLNSTTNPQINANTTSGLPPLAVSFSASATADPGENLEYFWDFGDGNTSTAQNPAHTYAEEGIHMVMLEVRDGAGGSDRATRRVFVGNSEPTARIALSESIVLPGVEVTLDGSGSSDPDGDPLTYEWTLGDGRTLTGEVVTASWPDEATFPITLRVTDPAGNVNVARTSIQVENQPPVAHFSFDSLGGFVPFTVNFDASDSFDPEGEPLLYEWNFRDGTPVVQTSEPFISHEFTTPGDFDVRLTVYDPAGKSGQRTRTITALGPESIIPSTADTGEIAQGLSYRVFAGDPNIETNLPNIETLRPLKSGRVANLDFLVSDRDTLFVIRYEGYLYVPETGAYAFRMRTQNQSRFRLSGELIVGSGFPHSHEYLALVALEAGYHPYRFETTYNPADPWDRPNFNDLTWAPPGTDRFRPVPESLHFSNINLLEATFRATPTTVYDGGTVQFEATTDSPDGEPLHFHWDFGDGNTATGRSVAHTYNLPSNLAHRVYSAVLTVTDSGGATQTVGELVTVSRYAGLVMRPMSSIGATQYNFDRRTSPRNILEAVNHAVEPGTQLYYSSQLRADLGAAMVGDGAYQTRWVSSNPVDYIWYHFQKDGVDKAYNITEYSITAGGLAWTANRDPKNWRIYGSNDPDAFDIEPGADNPSWTLIDEVTGQSGEARIIPIIYTLPNTEAYAHYLFRFENQSGGIAGEVELTELQVFSYFDNDPAINGNQPPAADLQASVTRGEPPLTVAFDASATTDPDNDWLYFSWDFGDGHAHDLLLGQDTFEHTYFQPGTYEAVVTVRDGNGAVDTASVTIIVDPPTPNEAPVPAFTPGAAVVPAGTAVTFDASATFDPDGDAMEFHWEFGDGRRASGEVVSHAFDKAGVFDVVLIVRDERGRSSGTHQSIEVLPPNGGRPAISFNFDRRSGRMSHTVGAGVVPVAFWNNLITRSYAAGWFDSHGEPVDITVSDGRRQSSVVVTSELEDRMDGNQRLAQVARTHQVYGSDRGMRWIVEDVPYPVYNVYVYYAGAADANAYPFEVNGVSRYARKDGHGFDGTWTVSEAAAPGEAAEGHNVLLWRNVTGSTMTLELNTGNNRPAIFGFQIVDRTGADDAPPVVAITSPADGDWFHVGEPVALSGSAQDGQDPVDDPFLEWSSDIDGVLGLGGSLTVDDLSPGTHTLSLTATNSADMQATASVVIDIFTEPAAPVIVSHPQDITSFETATIAFTVVAQGSPPFFTYQWRKDGEPLEGGPRVSGVHTHTLTLADISDGDAGSYDVVVSNDMGSVVSQGGALEVTELIAPSIAAHPQSTAVNEGGELVLSVEAAGSAPFSYQWRRNGAALSDGGGVSGANTATLRVSSFGPGDEGSYDVVVSNAGGNAVSDAADVSIFVLPSMDAVLAEWNFNHFASTTTTNGFEEMVDADVGAGVLFVRSATSTGTNFRRETGGGTEINAATGTPAGGSIELRRGSRWDNGVVEFRFDMTGFEAAVISFAYETRSTLPGTATVEWSADGGETYTQHSVLQSADYTSGFTFVALDFAEVEALNNAADARVRLRYSADGGAGNTGTAAVFDNVRIEARRSTSGYNDWRADRFGDTEHPDGEPGADPFKRGIRNVIDYALGLDHLENPHAGLPRGGEGISLHFTRRAEVEFLIVVEETQDLASDEWDIIAFLEPGADTWTAVAERAVITEETDGPVHHVTVNPSDVPSPGAPRFWRMSVQGP